MRIAKHFMIGLISVTFVCGSVGLVQPPPTQADVQFGGVKKILKKFFPPCGPGTRDQRFVVKGEKVCDNKTGLWWQQSPGSPGEIESSCDNQTPCEWKEAIDYCANLELTGKHHKKKQWRLAEVEELFSLVDYRVTFPPAPPMLPPDHPFSNVQGTFYWSGTSAAPLLPSSFAWGVGLNLGLVDLSLKKNPFLAWCVSGVMGVAS